MDYYGSDDDMYFDDHVDDEYGNEYVSDDNERDSKPSPSEKRYTILNEAEIKRRQDEDVSAVSSVLSLSISDATLLLYHYNWDVVQAQDSWFANEKSVRTKVGLLIDNARPKKPSSSMTKPVTCGICYDDDLPLGQVRSASCGHIFCTICWGSYISTSINDSGAGCLSLRCPEHKCPAAVGLDMVNELALSDDDKAKYSHYLIRSYVEFNKFKIKWCPGPGCNNAVRFVLGVGESEVYDVLCDCSHAFCFNCDEEPHRPLDCETVNKWNLKNLSEAENTKWILAFSKPCPKCQRPIEKNQGCNHMTCGKPCGHHFCWLCGRSLSGNYICNCNGFASRMAKAQNDKDTQRENAKKALERYAHYYERWAGNHKSGKKATQDLIEMKESKIHVLSDKLDIPVTQLEFIVKAWERIVNCRRVLKWTYAYGYFKLENQHDKRKLFEYSQGEAESSLERLHYSTEIEVGRFFEADVDYPSEQNVDFTRYRQNLVNLTNVTGVFFENLVQDLENGMPEVRRQPKKKRRGSTSRQKANEEDAQVQVSMEEAVDVWQCDRCTFLNPAHALTCGICFEEIIE